MTKTIGYSKTKEDFKKLKPITDNTHYTTNLDIVLDALCVGDVLVVCSLSVFGYRTKGVFELVTGLLAKGIYVVSLDENIDTRTPEGAAIFTNCKVFLDIDRQVINNKIKIRKDLSKTNGLYPGRPRNLTREQEKQILAIRDSGTMTPGETCKLFKISKSVYYRLISKESL